MELGWALLIWLVVAILVFIIARNYRIRIWSAIVLALVIATIVLGIIRPPNTLAWRIDQANGLAGLYWLIMFIVPLVVLVYVVGKAVTDREAPAAAAAAPALRVSTAPPVYRI